MKDIFDITYNANGSTTVYYTDGSSSTTMPGATGQTGYGSGQNGNGPAYSSGTSKKWWEVALGVFPAIVAGIFGNNNNNGYMGQYPAGQYPSGQYPYNYQQSAGLGGSGNMNMILIIGVAVVVLFLLLGKKK